MEQLRVFDSRAELARASLACLIVDFYLKKDSDYIGALSFVKPFTFVLLTIQLP